MVTGTVESRTQPVAFGAARAITEQSAEFVVLAGLHGTTAFYPFSNDRGLGWAYQRARKERDNQLDILSMSQNTATMIVGNGSFESACEMIPREDIVLFCDINPLTLFIQRALVETIKNEPDLDSFYRSKVELFDSMYRVAREVLRFSSVSSIFIPDVLDQEYEGRKKLWLQEEPADSAQAPIYFTDSEEAYHQARKGIIERTFGYYLIDFNSRAELSYLATVLRANNVELRQANVSNVFTSSYYASRGLDNFKKILPWCKNPVMIENDDWKAEVTTLASLGAEARTL